MHLILSHCPAPVYSPEDFIKEVDVSKVFQSLKVKSFSSPDRIPNLPIKYAARKLMTSSKCP